VTTYHDWMTNINRVYEVLQEEGINRLIKLMFQYTKEHIQPYIEWPESKTRLLKYRNKYGKSTPPLYNLIHIDPRSVQYILAPNFYTELPRRGYHIIGGDWDKNISDESLVYGGQYENNFDEQTLVPFENYHFYNSCDKHFNENIPWEETYFYTWVSNNIDHLGSRYATNKAIQERLDFIDNIYEDMNQNGYKTQDELGNHRGPHGYDEVLINITRNGQFILEDGRHRFTLAKILELDTVPVRIFVRHADWQQLRKMISTHSGNIANDDIPVNLDHLDIQDLIPI